MSASMSGLSFAPCSTPSLAPACTFPLSVLNDSVLIPNGASTPGIKAEEEGFVVEGRPVIVELAGNGEGGLGFPLGSLVAGRLVVVLYFLAITPPDLALVSIFILALMLVVFIAMFVNMLIDLCSVPCVWKGLTRYASMGGTETCFRVSSGACHAGRASLSPPLSPSPSPSPSPTSPSPSSPSPFPPSLSLSSLFSSFSPQRGKEGGDWGGGCRNNEEGREERGIVVGWCGVGVSVMNDER